MAAPRSTKLALATQLGFLSLALAAPALEPRTVAGARCTTINYPITARASNFNITDVPTNLNDPFVFQNFLTSSAEKFVGAGQNGATTFETSGTYKISAIYCTPLVPNPRRANTIQYLQHAITADRNYWNGDSFPTGYQGERYSYIQTAINNGYSVLAPDTLGSGGSDHPDPINVVQQPLQLAINHEAITQLRAGTLPGTNGKRYNKVIFGGHSYGAISGNGMATHYPNDVDALVLIGYSPEFVLGAGPLEAGNLVPAAIENPVAFGTLSPGYLAHSIESGREFGFFTNPNSLGGYDHGAAVYDFQHEGTVAIGELATLFYGLGAADTYTGSIKVLTGRNDAIVCNVPPTPDCGSGETSLPAAAGAFYPKAKAYSYTIPDLTGHFLNLHYSGPASVDAAMDFLNTQGF